MFFATLALLFILRLRFPTSKSTVYILRQRYNDDVLQKYRRYEKLNKRLCKNDLDQQFLHSCKAHGIIPRFLHFKAYKKKIYCTTLYKECLVNLLDYEIIDKQRDHQRIQNDFNIAEDDLRQSISRLDMKCIFLRNTNNNRKYKQTVERVHQQKLHKLGANLQLNSLDPNIVVHNLSSYMLSKREKYLLSFGLDFCLPRFNINFHHYFLQFEKLYKNITQHQSYSNRNNSEFLNRLRNIAYSYYYKFNPRKVFSPIITRDDKQILRNLSKRKSITILRPDKGKGVVLLNTHDYDNKMQDILKDTSKFKCLINTDPYRSSLAIEDKINSFLRKLKNAGHITDELFKQLFASASAPGLLYGTAKIHKSNLPLRPIVAAYHMASHKISKFLVQLLKDITTSKSTIRNSYDFQESICNFATPNNCFMVSYDITSLYTNIPIQETITICLNKLFSTPQALVAGFNKEEFKKLLSLATTNIQFLFNNNLYEQQEGLAMGNAAAPSLANIFMNDMEERMLQECPESFKPIFYKRYLDDTCVIFKQPDDAEQFHTYINDFHPSIKFTMEKETNNTLPFLDVNITKCYNNNICSFSTSVYRKPTFTELGSSCYSYVPLLYKINAAKTLIHRAYHLSSNYILFSQEIKIVENYLINNGFLIKLIERTTARFLIKYLHQ